MSDSDDLKSIFELSLWTKRYRKSCSSNVSLTGAKRRERMGIRGMGLLLIVSVDHSLIPYYQWIGLRENLQETIDFPIKYGAFL